MKSRSTTAFCVLVLVLVAAVASAQAAKSILDATGVKGGLVVHVGCGEGKLTAALHANDRYIVVGLDADAANVAKAREHIRKLGLRGKVFADRLDGAQMPFADNVVNLVVSEDLGKVATGEVMRVLCPGGVAYIKKGGGWTKTVKPRPKNIDDWTHYLHDPGGNAVAHDTVSGPPRHMQWLAAPTWSRHHHTLASISSVVSTQGRIFYILDEAPGATMALPGKWSVIARGAFNGVLLWKRPMPSWAYHRKGFRSGPVQLPRTLVAVGDRVYVPLGMSEPVTALDAATGEVVRTYKQTGGAEEIVVSDGVLLVLTGSPTAEQAGVDPAWRGRAKYPNKKTIVAVRPETGEELWKWSRPGANPVPLTLAADGGRVFFECAGGVVCLGRDTGKVIWDTSSARPGRAEPTKRAKEPAKGTKAKKPRRKRGGKSLSGVGWSVATLVVHDGVVLLADKGKLSAMSAKDGKALWSCPSRPGTKSPADVFVVNGPKGKLVWTGPGFTEGRDLHTGEIKQKSTALRDLRTVGHHHRCYREKATDRYILSNYRGIEFLDLVSGDHSRNNWVRGVCQYGVMPCNGLIYAPSHACGCHMEAKLFGFWALAPRRQTKPAPARGPRIERGPVYSEISNLKSQISDKDWPTYRGNATRSGVTASVVPAAVKIAWKVDVGGKITQPVIAGGTLLVASVDTNTVHALDAAGGKKLWSYLAGGRVDSSPTIHKGLALFGCADGWVYCLRLSDGELVWRFRAAPEDRKTIAMDQVESVWPVHGSVLVHKGVAYCSAGRSSWLDGGVALYGLDPATGKVIHQSRLGDPHPKYGEGKDETAGKYARKFVQNATDYKTFKAPDRSDAFSMGGSTTDVLVADGESVYMRHLRFSAKLVKQDRMIPHLFSTSNLLDGEENHRSHWVFGTGDFSRTPVAYSWITYRPGNWGSHLAVPYGIMMTYDDKTVWGVKRGHLMRGSIGGGYTVFAQGRPKPSAGDKHLPDFRKPTGKPVLTFQWTARLSIRPRAMLKAGELLYFAGMPDRIDANDPFAVHEGRKGAALVTLSATDGARKAECPLDSPPVWDGMSAAGGKLYVSTMAGQVLCMVRDESPPTLKPAAPTASGKPSAQRPAARGGRANPPKPVQPDATGKLLLTPAAAKTVGRLRYQADRNNLGGWTAPADYCQWRLQGVKAGKYAVEFSYGSTYPGVAYTIVAGDQELTGKTRSTGGIKTYKAFPIGTITLPAGEVTLAVKPGEFTGAIMNFRLLTLTPVK